MITTHGIIEYKVTAIEIMVAIPGNDKGVDMDEQELENAFTMELSTYPLGIEVKQQTMVSYDMNGFTMYHNDSNTWTRQYTIKIIEPIRN